MARQAGKDWIPAVRNSGSFVKHVAPTVVKPLHSLWHEFLGFIFLLFAGIGAYKMWRESANMTPLRFAIIGFFVLIMAAYGLGSILKARRISRS